MPSARHRKSNASLGGICLGCSQVKGGATGYAAFPTPEVFPVPLAIPADALPDQNNVAQAFSLCIPLLLRLLFWSYRGVPNVAQAFSLCRPNQPPPKGMRLAHT